MCSQVFECHKLMQALLQKLDMHDWSRNRLHHTDRRTPSIVHSMQLHQQFLRNNFFSRFMHKCVRTCTRAQWFEHPRTFQACNIQRKSARAAHVGCPISRGLGRVLKYQNSRTRNSGCWFFLTFRILVILQALIKSDLLRSQSLTTCSQFTVQLHTALPHTLPVSYYQSKSVGPSS